MAQREKSIAQWQELPLVERLAAPLDIKAPDVVVVSPDGGRMQRRDLPDTAKSHWCEDKVGALKELQPDPHDCDPSPQIPDKFLDVVAMDEVTCEIKYRVPKGTPFAKCAPATERVTNAASELIPTVIKELIAAVSEPVPLAVTQMAPTAVSPLIPVAALKFVPTAATEPVTTAASQSVAAAKTVVASTDVVAEARAAIVMKPPVIESRDVLASLEGSEKFGKHLADHAWSLGFAGRAKAH